MSFLNLDKKIFLAPMAGFTDESLRSIADSFGADGTVSEMISARAIRYKDEKSKSLMRTKAHRGLYGIQLFGFDPKDFDFAVRVAAGLGPDFIDINVGCPAPKITGSGSGSRLMKNLPLAFDIVNASVKAAGGIPVSVKMRAGWDENSVNCDMAAKACRERGAAFITVHGRTRRRMYRPGINYDAIRAAKLAVNTPVFGNGDIRQGEDRLNMLSLTGCDAVMVGRAALGNPWIFNEIKRTFAWKPAPPKPTVKERMELFLNHMELMCSEYGEETGMKKGRGHAPYYMKGLRGAARLRGLSNNLSRYSDRQALALRATEENPE